MAQATQNNTIQRFEARKGSLLKVIAGVTTVICFLPVLFKIFAISHVIPGLFYSAFFMVLALPLGTYLLYSRTFYLIDKETETLTVYCIFKVCETPIADIRQVVKKNVPVFSGYRYALSSQNGLVIEASNVDSYFINPRHTQNFLANLQKIRETIDIKT